MQNKSGLTREIQLREKQRRDEQNCEALVKRKAVRRRHAHFYDATASVDKPYDKSPRYLPDGELIEYARCGKTIKNIKPIKREVVQFDRAATLDEFECV